MKPYMKDGLQTEDPLDGKWPPKHHSQKKGARQKLKKMTELEFLISLSTNKDITL